MSFVQVLPYLRKLLARNHVILSIVNGEKVPVVEM